VLNDSTEIPGALQGSWRVLSYRDPNGEGGLAPEGERWIIGPRSVSTLDFEFQVEAVEADTQEVGETLYLISFSNNSLQFTVLTAESMPVDIAVVWLRDAEELRRYHLSKIEPYSEN
jgi:hypothetical protein